MKYWNKSFATYLRCLTVWCGLLVAGAVHADPNDPLEQLLRQRQQSQNQDSDGLESLIRSRSDNAPVRLNIPAPAPVVRGNSHSSVPVVRGNASVRHARNDAIRPAVASNSRGDADALLSNAMGLLGVAYRFGGTSPRTGFDCSGFMQHIFRKAFAVNLPRTSAQQAQVGSYVSRSNLQAGDMVFFRTAGRRISHVGMYVGNDRFIHAPRTGKRIEITSLSSRYWSARYATARRVKRQGADNFIR